MSTIPEITVQEFKSWQDETKNVKLIDVREEWERDIARLNQDIHIPLAGFQEAISDYPKDDTYVIYCHHGRRSLAAAMAMKEAGFKEVYNLAGGVDAWAKEIDQNMSQY